MINAAIQHQPVHASSPVRPVSLFKQIYATADEQTRLELDECAACLEYDAHLPRHTAEERAAREWRKSHEI